MGTNDVFDLALFEVFKKVASHKFSTACYAWHLRHIKGLGRPDQIIEEQWPNWIEWWNSTKFKLHSTENTKNRMTEVDGKGSGVSKNWGALGRPL